MLRRLDALPAREEALEPAAEPGLELVFFPRALPVSETPGNEREIIRMVSDIKQLLDEVFVISGIIKVEVRVISRSRRLRLITLTETQKPNLIIVLLYIVLKKITTNALSQRST